MSSAVSDPENASSHKGKRIRSFSVSFKLTVIAEVEASSNRSTAKKFDVDERVAYENGGQTKHPLYPLMGLWRERNANV